MLRSIKQFLVSPERDQLPDLLKGAAVLDMILGHILDLFLVSGKYDEIVYYLRVLPGAPLFTAVMGYYVFISQKGFGEQIKRGIKLIVWGLLLNVGLNFHLLIKIYSGEFLLSPYTYIFGADILTFAGLSVMILSSLKLIFKENIYLYALVGLFSLAVHKFLPTLPPASPYSFIQAFFWGEFSWSYFPIFPWLFYPSAGCVTAILIKKYGGALKNYTNYILFAAFIITFLTFDYGLKTASDYHLFYHHGLLFGLRTIVIVIFIVTVFHLLEKKFSRNTFVLYTKWIGKNVTLFYVFQWLIIGNTATAIYQSLSFMESLVSFIIVLSIVTILVILWNRYFKRVKLVG